MRASFANELREIPRRRINYPFSTLVSKILYFYYGIIGFDVLVGLSRGSSPYNFHELTHVVVLNRGPAVGDHARF